MKYATISSNDKLHKDLILSLYIDLNDNGCLIYGMRQIHSIFTWKEGCMSMENKSAVNDYVVIKAKEDGVNVIGLTRGSDTKFHHSEKLDKGEVLIAQFTEHTSAIKIRGAALIKTEYGDVESEGKNEQSHK